MADAFADLPQIEAGCRMPGAHAIATGDQATRDAARFGSEALLAAMLRYYERHHPRG